MITEIWGMTPDARTLRWKISAYPPSESTPSWMRAPPESLRPMTGAPMSIALSMIFWILSDCASPREPPRTVKSCEKTKTRRPLMRPCPVMTESPGYLSFSMPNSVQRCSRSWSYSRKEPSSMRMERRSRALSFPFLCCESMRFCPPPSSARSRKTLRSSRNLATRDWGCTGNALRSWALARCAPPAAADRAPTRGIVRAANRADWRSGWERMIAGIMVAAHGGCEGSS
mmetsp:Transcript_25303/g.60471  ORF Transcript_25303/g.60471 Transcript_25303/m.60471 type:complete len:229 (+) Transcript_25303:831-1517(+)